MGGEGNNSIECNREHVDFNVLSYWEFLAYF